MSSNNKYDEVISVIYVLAVLFLVSIGGVAFTLGEIKELRDKPLNPYEVETALAKRGVYAECSEYLTKLIGSYPIPGRVSFPQYGNVSLVHSCDDNGCRNEVYLTECTKWQLVMVQNGD